MKNTEIRQRIEEKLEHLTREELILVENYLSTSFSAQKSLNQPAQSEEERIKLIYSLQGKYAHIGTSSEEFAQRKQEEIDWDDRNR
ncbi:MAG TPA: hypothetical protein V6C58_27435 [Allocoleopsis sp.]